jgi:hypothetical protein
MADPIIPTPDQNEGAPAGGSPPPLAPLNASGTQASDPGASSYAPQGDTASQFNSQYVEPFLKNYISSFTTDAGKEYALRQADELRTHFYMKQQADMATVAGHQVVNDAESNINSMATLAREDPSSTDLALKMYDTHLNATILNNPNLTGDQAAQVKAEYGQKGKEQIALAHYYGLANRTPQVALDELKAGKYTDILPQNAVEAIQMHANEVIRMQTEGAKAQAEAQLKAEKDQFKAATVGVFRDMFQPDGTLRTSGNTYTAIQQASLMPGADPSEIKSMMEAAQTARKDQIDNVFVASDPHTYQQFTQRMTLPQGAPGALTNNDIYQAVAHHRLSTADARIFMDAREKVDADPDMRNLHSNINKITETLKSTITNSNPLGGTTDPLGDQRYSQFLSGVQQRVTSMTNQGMKAQDIEKALLDPRSPTYIGSEAGFYAPTKAQSQAALSSWARNGMPPITPIYDPYLSSSSSAKVPVKAGGAVSGADWLAARKAAQPQGK